MVVSDRLMTLIMCYGQFEDGPNSDWNETFYKANAKGSFLSGPNPKLSSFLPKERWL